MWSGLYRPAAASGHAARADDFAAAKELAAWTSRVRDAWRDVSVEHVDSMGVSDEPQIGESLTVNAYVRLGPLAPDSVTVQVVHGQVTENDDLAQTSTDDLTVADELGDGRYLFTRPGDHRPFRFVRLQRAGAAQASGPGQPGRARPGRQRHQLIPIRPAAPRGRVCRAGRVKPAQGGAGKGLPGGQGKAGAG